MAIWYGSVNTLSIVRIRCFLLPETSRLTSEKAAAYALLDLYSHPEIVEPLRNEVKGVPVGHFAQNSHSLPLLDSFLRESARLSAFESSKFLFPFLDAVLLTEIVFFSWRSARSPSTIHFFRWPDPIPWRLDLRAPSLHDA
jgi:hypothetical protein